MVQQCLLKRNLYMKTIDKKDARILWNVKDEKLDSKITSLVVEEFLLDPKTRLYNNQHLYKIFQKDIGNCLSEWDKTSNGEMIFKIFSNASPENDMVRKDIFREFFKIKEFRLEFKKYLHYFFTDDEIDEYTEIDKNNDTITTQK